MPTLAQFEQLEKENRTLTYERDMLQRIIENALRQPSVEVEVKKIEHYKENEQKFIELFIKGLSHRAIAEEMGMKRRGIEGLDYRLKKKMKVKNHIEMVVYLFRNNLVK